MDKRDFALLCGVLIEETGQPVHMIVNWAAELEKIAARVGRRSIHQCNYPMTEEQLERAQRADARDYARADEIMAGLGLPPVLRQGDPRGYAVKLVLPKSKRWNSMGGQEEGWGI